MHTKLHLRIPVALLLVRIASHPIAQEATPAEEALEPQQFDIQRSSVQYVGVSGGIYSAQTANQGRIHVRGGFGVATADYSRADYDGVPEKISDLSFSPELAVIFRILHAQSMVRQLTLSIGTDNGLTNTDYGNIDQLDAWYESNSFAGLALTFPADFAAGLTYVFKTNPNGTSSASDELDVALRYGGETFIGRWGPSVEAVIPLEESAGVLLQLVVQPSYTLFSNRSLPLTISLPLEASAGLGGFHVEGDDFTGYFVVGLESEIALESVSAEYGSWGVNLGVEMLVRDDQIADANREFDDTGNVVVIGVAGIAFFF